VHQRLVTLLKTLEPSQFERAIQHPERGPLTLTAVLSLYAWHSRHHVAQITAQRARNGW